MEEYRIALIGNPNVGKSTVFNALTGLHQHTGNWAGKTVEGASGEFVFHGKHFSVTDLPGIYSLYDHAAEETAARDHLIGERPDAVIVVCDACCPERNLPLALQAAGICGHIIVCLNLMDEAGKRGITVDAERLSGKLGMPVVCMSARDGDMTGLLECLETIVQTVPPERSAVCRDTASAVRMAEEITRNCVTFPPEHDARDRRIDRILLGRWGIPVMLLLLCVILWLTMTGANLLSGWLSGALFAGGEMIRSGLEMLHTPEQLISLFVDGIYRTTAWVTAVMLPPMAIFFPLFTLLEDAGYLPRAAYLLDRPLRRAGGCGKQALTMCMGLGCNACGVVGCRIIESPRERLAAMLTNVFMPCNGRFPLLISLTAMFLVTDRSLGAAAAQAGILALVIVCGAGMTLLVTKLLSGTLLRGERSTFLLELPPYRMPQIRKTLVRSFLDRTVYVLGRAAAVAAPAGLILWLMVHIRIGGTDLLSFCAGHLDPFAQLFGMDGMILLAFVLAFPANEIVLPVILMGYLSQGTLTEIGDPDILREILTAHGWTPVTALCVMAFSLMHFPCSTTFLTIRRETGSWKQALFSLILPTVCGLTVCFLIRLVSSWL
jgi:ferrous iron transport protein B